ncbi:ABC transporter substrate-binding protein [Fodinibius sp.]|uniref:MlaC/ttg2D family ABC transporter substrate-binding protein n=1 Tax=Fodinibius sp. TaxID=1872440 RepID=UPI002ACD5B31|nr:ABC transporter substrate-binding protein [Fodinibius sp.]MDZ7659810.1 ABC transporter substrate-binding protein [Fodinibius sp.]
MTFLNKLYIVLLSALLGLMFLSPTNSFAQLDSSTVRNLLEERDDEIKDLLGPKGTEYTQEQRDKLKDIINGIIDYRAMAQQALQATYDTLSTEQRSEFVDLFSTIIRDQSLNKLDIYRADVKYEQINVEDSSATVKTLAQLEKVRTPVSYEMKFNGKNDQWVVTDIIIDDVSTAGSYQRQFQNIIRKKGYDSLLETLRKRAAK